jgi:hypothetical protein
MITERSESGDSQQLLYLLTVIANLPQTPENSVGQDGRTVRNSAEVERVARVSANDTLPIEYQYWELHQVGLRLPQREFLCRFKIRERGECQEKYANRVCLQGCQME